jgi:hypothetical protein
MKIEPDLPCPCFPMWRGTHDNGSGRLPDFSPENPGRPSIA